MKSHIFFFYLYRFSGHFGYKNIRVSCWKVNILWDISHFY